MATDVPGSSGSREVKTLLAVSTAEERRLLKQERKAERRLLAARKKLANDQRRLQRSRERVDRDLLAITEAETVLRECQALRAAGPPLSLD